MNVRVIPELSSVIITLISAFILYLILKRFLYAPVTEFIEERQENIQGDLDQAKISKNEAMNLKKEYEQRISKAKAEGQEIIESSRQRGNEIKENILEEAREEARLIIDRAERDIEREKEQAYTDIKESTGEMAILIASRIMEENITMDNQKYLIDKFIDEVGNSEWQI